MLLFRSNISIYPKGTHNQLSKKPGEYMGYEIYRKINILIKKGF